jgi:hypothetical protein
MSSGGASGLSSCGAPPLSGEFEDVGTVAAVLAYFSDPTNTALTAGDAAVGAANTVAHLVYVTRGRGKNGKYVVEVAEYTDDFAFLQKHHPRGSGMVNLAARRVGGALLILDAARTLHTELNATMGHPTHYRVGYAVFETAAKVGGAAAGAYGGGKLGGAIGCTVGLAVGCFVGGGIGAAIGGFTGHFIADHATDLIWEVTPVS